MKVTKDSFEQEVLKSDVPVLVDFWASWCGPCKMLSPVVDEIESEYHGTYKVCQVNIDEEMELAGMYRITSVPTLLVFNNGTQVDGTVGVTPKDRIVALLDKAGA